MDGLAVALCLEVLIQSSSQRSGIAANDVVFAWIVIRGAIEDGGTDALLGQITRVSFEALLADMKKELRKERGPGQAFAGRDAARQRPFLAEIKTVF